jgi:hypothetical protein
VGVFSQFIANPKEKFTMRAGAHLKLAEAALNLSFLVGVLPLSFFGF